MNNTKVETYFSLLNVCLKLKSESEEFSDFAADFTGLSVSGKDISEPDIYVNLHINREMPAGSNRSKISRSIQQGKTSVYIMHIERLHGLSFKVCIKNNKLIVDAYLSENEKTPLIRSLLIKKKRKKNNLYKFIVLVYYLINIPYFYYLERFRDSCLIHAGAFEYRNNGIILSGLGGVGKSTFTLASPFFHESRIISDNLIFHDKEKIYSFPELIAIDKKSSELLGNSLKNLTPGNLPSSHGRKFYRVSDKSVSSDSTPKYLFWLQQGTSNRVTPIDKNECIKKLLNINLLANELREYYVFAAALDLVFSESLPPDKYSQNLSSLISRLHCYILEFTPNDDINKVYKETIAKIIL